MVLHSAFIGFFCCFMQVKRDYVKQIFSIADGRLYFSLYICNKLCNGRQARKKEQYLLPGLDHDLFCMCVF